MADFNQIIVPATPATLEELYRAAECFPQALPKTPVAKRIARSFNNNKFRRHVHVKGHSVGETPHLAVERSPLRGALMLDLPYSDPSICRLSSFWSATWRASAYCSPMNQRFYSRYDEPETMYILPSIYAEDTDVSHTPSTLLEMSEQQRCPITVGRSPS